MPLELDLEALVGRQESTSSLVRFEDETDVNAPRLRYSVPLPGSYEGRFYVEVPLDDIAWTPLAMQGKQSVPAVLDLDFSENAPAGRGGPSLDELASLPPPATVRESSSPADRRSLTEVNIDDEGHLAQLNGQAVIPRKGDCRSRSICGSTAGGDQDRCKSHRTTVNPSTPDRRCRRMNDTGSICAY